jgi:hypothetical protein
MICNISRCNDKENITIKCDKINQITTFEKIKKKKDLPSTLTAKRNM